VWVCVGVCVCVVCVCVVCVCVGVCGVCVGVCVCVCLTRDRYPVLSQLCFRSPVISIRLFFCHGKLYITFISGAVY